MPVQEKYIARYLEQLERIGKDKNELSKDVQLLIEKFDAAKTAFEAAGETEREKFLNLLIQSDAFISALLYKLYPESEDTDASKSKLLSMKAKALKLKMNFKN